MLAFYKSPVGQKMQAQEPKAINASLQYMRDWSQKFGDDVFAKFHDEMKKRGKPITCLIAAPRKNKNNRECSDG